MLMHMIYCARLVHDRACQEEGHEVPAVAMDLLSSPRRPHLCCA